MLAEAERLLQAGDPQAARRELQLLVDQFPNDPVLPRALLRTAELFHTTRDRLNLERVAARLLADHPADLETARALYLEASLRREIAHDLDDLRDARLRFRRIPLLFGRDRFARLDARVEARIASGEISLELGEPLTAAAELLTAVEDETASAALDGRAELGLARAWLALGEWIAAAETLERLATSTSSTLDLAVRRRADSLLGLIHRRILRPLEGEPPWLRAERFPGTGLELADISGVAASYDGRLLVVDPRLSVAVLLDADGHEIRRLSVDEPSGPGWLSDGRPFLLLEGNVILPFDGSSWGLADPRRGSALKDPLAAARGGLGDWFVVARGQRSLIQVPSSEATGDLRPLRELMVERRVDPVDVASGPYGSVYVLDAKNNEVLRVDATGARIEVAVNGAWKKAAALDLDALGNLYILDRAERRVELYAPNGQRQAAFGPQFDGGIELRQPVDLAVDGSGRLFLADAKLPFLVRLD